MENKKWRLIDKWYKKIRAINYLGNKCEICGDDNIHHLSFHYKFNKEFELCDLKGIRWSVIKQEIQKCELLCENCHMEKHYLERNSDDSRRKSKIIYLEYKGNKCQRCGYNKCEASLSFHHRDKKYKNFFIGSLGYIINNISELKEHIIKELDNCDILCKNCHIELHTDVDFFEKNKEEIYHKVENYKEMQGKISREDVINMYKSGIKQIDIAKYFRASKGTISNIIKIYNSNQ